MLRSTVLTLALLGLTAPAHAADFADPTWPCVQRKVESLSWGLMWAVPTDPEALPDDAAARQDIAELAGALSLRRIPLEDLAPRMEEFANTYDGDPDLLSAVFLTVFDKLDTRRTRIINGIGDFSLSQIALSEQIRETRTRMDAQLAKSDPDFDQVDQLEEQLDWDQLIYNDRQSSIQYLCETPVILEKRLFSIAQMLQQFARDPG